MDGTTVKWGMKGVGRAKRRGLVLPLLALLLAGSACGAESPVEGFEAFAAHGQDGDFDAMWARMYGPTRWQAEVTLGSIAVQFLTGDGYLEVGDIVAMAGPELLALFYQQGQTNVVALLDGTAEVVLLHQKGEEALVLVRSDDEQAIVPMRREGRVWKVDGSWGPLGPA